MKKEILLVATTLTLVMTGCVQKKLNTTIDTGSTTAPTGNTGSVNNGSVIYDNNIDPIGQGMGQGNGTYDMNGEYGDNSSVYGNSGVKNIYFSSNQYHITSDKLGQISQNARLLQKSTKVKVEGHCDASGSDEYNYALGLRRAKATKDALVLNGLPANKITLVSMGESAPECEYSSSADCYAKNRRVEFKVMQ